MNVIYYVGLNVHNDSIAVAIAPSDSSEVRQLGILGGSHEHVQRCQVTPGRPSRRRAPVLLRGRAARVSALLEADIIAKGVCEKAK